MKDQKADEVILMGAEVWNEWPQNNHMVSFNRPHWYDCPDKTGVQIKGENKLNFRNMHFKGTSIYNAFAENLNLSGSVFEDVVIEEGDFDRAIFIGCMFKNTRFNKTILTNSRFNDSTFVNCNLNRVNLTGADFSVKEITETVVYGISSWDLSIGKESKQSKLVIERTYDFYSDFIDREEMPLMVDDIELAQFIYYLSNHKKIRDTLNILNQKGVLLLGQFMDGGLERLYKIRDQLQAKGYMPMIFDFNRPENLSNVETIVTMAGLSKFIIADLSGPSVPHELATIFINHKKPLLSFGKHPYALFPTLSDQTKVTHVEGDIDDLLKQLDTKIGDLELHHNQRIMNLIKQDQYK